MSLLIDGHNLIGRMADMSLSDPDDEVELVQRLRRYCLRQRRRATVVFDAGLPGGPAPQLSAPPVEVVFASVGSSADCVIRRRILQARDPRGLVVVSSDRALQQAARSRGAQVVQAEQFAARLTGQPTADSPLPDRLLPEDEVAQWLALFEPGDGCVNTSE